MTGNPSIEISRWDLNFRVFYVSQALYVIDSMARFVRQTRQNRQEVCQPYAKSQFGIARGPGDLSVRKDESNLSRASQDGLQQRTGPTSSLWVPSERAGFIWIEHSDAGEAVIWETRICGRRNSMLCSTLDICRALPCPCKSGHPE